MQLFDIIKISASILVILSIIIALGRYFLKKYLERYQWKSERREMYDKIIPEIRESIKPIPIMADKISTLYNNLVRVGYTASKLPIRLTKKGNDMVKELNIKETVKKYKREFENVIEGLDALNPYRIQQKCISVVNEHFEKIATKDEILTVENKAFSEGVSIYDILYVYGIVLRNEILAEKNIDISHIDKHDPVKKNRS